MPIPDNSFTENDLAMFSRVGVDVDLLTEAGARRVTDVQARLVPDVQAEVAGR